MFKRTIQLLFFILFVSALSVNGQSKTYQKLPDGILIRLSKKTPGNAQTIKLQVVSDKIVRVVASATDTFSKAPSLIIVDKPGVATPGVATPGVATKWDVQEAKELLTLKTDALRVTVSTQTGEVTFLDSQGNTVLKELTGGGKSLEPVTIDGTRAFRLHQQFDSPADEALYGLGQHQTNLMNYKGKEVDMMQYNSTVTVPFLVSSRNYGLLWDNYSYTRFGDPRPYEQLSTLKLYAKDGTPGGLTANYGSRKEAGKVYANRVEKEIDYAFLTDQSKFPAGFPQADGFVTWEGSIESPFEGEHKFYLWSAGYIKISIDGKLLVDRWRESWNPGPTHFSLPLTKGKKHSLKIEWTPDSGESYISLKWLSPSPETQQRISLLSEMGDQIDYYFVLGKNMDEVVSGYRQLTGKAQVMPKWAMGFWQSRERYKTQDEVLQTMAEFRKRQIPIDNIVLDWSYWKEDQWGSHEFAPERFPDAKGMITELHDKYKAHFMISAWPKFYEGIENYKAFDQKGWLYQQSIKNRQRDWIGKGYVSTFYDAYQPQARQLFWDQLNKNLYSKGVDAWWMDASEPDILSNASMEERKKLMNPTYLGSSTKYFNAFPLMNAKGIYEGQRKTNPNQRVFILTRSAFAGIQRYGAATWSGDIAARFDEMERQIPAGLNFALSGLPYWTTDIGGFFVEDKYDRQELKGETLEEWRELNTRWYQYGVFCPLFRVHGQFPYREIFNIAPEEHPAYQSMLYYDKLRYRLMPYIYSLTGKIHLDNYTLMRPLVMDFGSDVAVRNIGDQFMFGPSLLVSPVYTAKARSRKMYLPTGTNWYDFYTGKYQQGGQTIEADAAYERIPVFVKEGSIIPFGPEIQYTTEKPADPITLYLYTGKNATFELYEDENVNYNYEKGNYALIPIRYDEASRTLTIEDRKGSFANMITNRTFEIITISKDQPKGWTPLAKAAQTIRYTGKKQAIRIP